AKCLGYFGDLQHGAHAVARDDFDFAAAGLKQPEQQLDGGGLACPVRSEQSEQFAGPNLKIEAVDSCDCSESFGNASQFRDDHEIIMNWGRKHRQCGTSGICSDKSHFGGGQEILCDL